MDLGANEWTTFWKVTFPLILPGIIAAALLAFSLSIDDYVVTSFTAGQTHDLPALHLRLAADRHPGPGQRHRHDHLPERGRLRGSSRSSWPAPPRPVADRRPGRVGAVQSRRMRTRARLQRADHDRHRDRRRRGRTAARPLGRARRSGPDHEPRRRARRGLLADHHRRRALPRLHLGDRRDEHRATRIRGSRPRSRSRRRSCSTASRTSSTTSPGLRLYERLRHVLPGEAVGGVPLELAAPRRSRPR